jgi:hypothetical protein
MTEVSPGAAAAVVSLHKATTGNPRMVAYCRPDCLALAQTLVPLLKSRGVSVELYVHQDNGRVPIAGQALVGLSNAAHTAGMCDHFAAGRRCPFLEKNGFCNFNCWPGLADP